MSTEMGSERPEEFEDDSSVPVICISFPWVEGVRGCTTSYESLPGRRSLGEEIP
jgi:hypothetical protein